MKKNINEVVDVLVMGQCKVCNNRVKLHSKFSLDVETVEGDASTMYMGLAFAPYLLRCYRCGNDVMLSAASYARLRDALCKYFHEEITIKLHNASLSNTMTYVNGVLTKNFTPPILDIYISNHEKVIKLLDSIRESIIIDYQYSKKATDCGDYIGITLNKSWICKEYTKSRFHTDDSKLTAYADNMMNRYLNALAIEIENRIKSVSDQTDSLKGIDPLKDQINRIAERDMSYDFDVAYVDYGTHICSPRIVIYGANQDLYNTIARCNEYISAIHGLTLSIKYTTFDSKIYILFADDEDIKRYLDKERIFGYIGECTFAVTKMFYKLCNSLANWLAEEPSASGL